MGSPAQCVDCSVDTGFEVVVITVLKGISLPTHTLFFSLSRCQERGEVEDVGPGKVLSHFSLIL